MAKRGRPPLLSEQYYQSMKMIYNDVKSKRGIQNIHYAIDAIRAIEEMDNIREFFFNKKTEEIAWSVLTELGRYGDHDLIRDVAKQVYEIVMADGDLKVKELIKILRNHRLSVQKK